MNPVDTYKSRDTFEARDTFKARDVEELVDDYLHRRAANVMLRVLAPTPITPNQVTVLSGAVAIAAGVIMGLAGITERRLMLAGAAVFFLSIVLDCTDGQLARLRKSSSFAGRALDGYTDVVSTAAIFLGQLAWLLANDVPLWLTQVVGWSAAFSVKWHTHVYDHVKNLYLHNTKEPKPGDVAFPSLDDIDQERSEHEAAGRWFSALLCRGFRQFTIAQRKGLKDQAGLDRPAMASSDERSVYRRVFRLQMRLWSYNGLGTHLALLVAATALAPVWSTAPLWAWAVIAGPMNIYTVLLKLREASLERRLREGLHPATH